MEGVLVPQGSRVEEDGHGPAWFTSLGTGVFNSCSTIRTVPSNFCLVVSLCFGGVSFSQIADTAQRVCPNNGRDDGTSDPAGSRIPVEDPQARARRRRRRHREKIEAAGTRKEPKKASVHARKGCGGRERRQDVPERYGRIHRDHLGSDGCAAVCCFHRPATRGCDDRRVPCCVSARL